MATAFAKSQIAVSTDLLALREALMNDKSKPLARFEIGDMSAELRKLDGAIWALLRRKDFVGGLALRAVYAPIEFDMKEAATAPGEHRRFIINSVAGEHCIIFETQGGLEQFRMRVCFTPAAPTFIPYLPRDLIPLGANDDPLKSEGTIEAVQRNLNAGFVFFRMSKPDFGTVLYLQDLTSLNDYFLATGTAPDSAVGGEWPELGYRIPTYIASEAEPKPLPAGQQVTLSNAVLVLRHDRMKSERQSALQFLQMLGSAYELLEHPETEFHDWVERARQTYRDLETSPKMTVRHYGHPYLHPYTDAEYPDSMVQLSIIAALRDWGKWNGEPSGLDLALAGGMRRFYDPKLKTLRRYLPNVGEEKQADAVDSWYLYHPLLNLGILALGGDKKAERLFMDSLEYGIKAAHHFNYEWPVQYNVQDFSVITDVAEADGRGQTDVGGIYAWVMLQAFELTDDNRYLDEARAAIGAAEGLRFDLNYQANLTAWGAAACMRLWRITNNARYVEQSYVYLASFFQNNIMWDSRIGYARHYQTFMAVTCLQDAPYMAMYECFDTFVAFDRYLQDSGPDLDPAARMLLSEYCKYALSRAWYYYPDALPPEAVSDKQREPNGHIDRTLSIPVEDLYPDGQPAGQVGQEVYGAGAAFIFATRMFHAIEDAPFRLFCNHFLRSVERSGERALTITLDGGHNCSADISLIRLKRRKLTACKLETDDGDVIRPHRSSDDRTDFRVAANGRVILTWE